MRCALKSEKLQLRIITSCFGAFTILRGFARLIERSRVASSIVSVGLSFSHSVLNNLGIFFLAALHMSSSRYGTRRLLSKLMVLSRRPIGVRGQVSINAYHAPGRWGHNGIGAELAESLVPWLQKALLILMDNYSWITTMSFNVQRMQICGFLCCAWV